jgi:hypothetical protein
MGPTQIDNHVFEAGISPDLNLSRNSSHLNHTRRSMLFRVATLLGIFVLLISTYFIFLPDKSPQLRIYGPEEPNPRLGWVTCGATVRQAREAGCIFDPMLNSWVPSPCYNKTESDFQIDRWQLRWYKDQYAKEEIPLEEYRRGEYAQTRVFTSMRHHVTHCKYVWHSVYLAFTGQADWITSDAMSQV